MTTSTTPTSTEFHMGGKALLATAAEITGAGNPTTAAKRAQAEIDRRAAKHTAPPVKAARITPAQVAAVAKAARKTGLGSRGGDLRKRLASEAARDENGVFSRDMRDRAYSVALTMSDEDVKSDLRELGFTVA